VGPYLRPANHGCWYGDGELYSTLLDLAAAPRPALTRDGDDFALTELGRALLAGEADWVESHWKDRGRRWQGGVVPCGGKTSGGETGGRMAAPPRPGSTWPRRLEDDALDSTSMVGVFGLSVWTVIGI